MVSFYSNLNRNVAMGGGGGTALREGGADAMMAKTSVEVSLPEAGTWPAKGGPNFLDGFEAPSQTDPSMGSLEMDSSKWEEPPKRPMREIREEKVAAARMRYYQRHGVGIKHS